MVVMLILAATELDHSMPLCGSMTCEAEQAQGCERKDHWTLHGKEGSDWTSES